MRYAGALVLVLFGLACCAGWMYLYWRIGGWWFWAMIPSAAFIVVMTVRAAIGAATDVDL